MSLQVNYTKQEQKQLDAFANMTDDERGELLHREAIERNVNQTVAKWQEHEAANSHVVQRSANGGIQVGGTLKADSLVTVCGIEMTLQQAIDVGHAESDIIGEQSVDLQDAGKQQFN